MKKLLLLITALFLTSPLSAGVYFDYLNCKLASAPGAYSIAYSGDVTDATNVGDALDSLQADLSEAAIAAGVSDAAYSANDWDSITATAPSKNAVRDKIESLSTVYQPLEATLTDIADGTISENLVNTANPWADNEVSDTITVGASGSVNNAALDSDLQTWAGVTPSANGQSLVAAANYAAMRSLLDLEAGTDFNAYDYDLGSLSAGITGLVKGAGNGGGYSAATAGSDYLAGAALSDSAYGAGWDSDTTHTASKNALYDAIAGLSSAYQAIDSDLGALAAISGQRGDLLYYSATGWARLAKGTQNYILAMGANDPGWIEHTSTGGSATFSGLTDVSLTNAAAGDVLYFNGTDWINLAKDVGKYLKSGASSVSWDTPAGAGDMVAASYPHIVAIEALAVTDSNFIVGNGSTWVAESGATVRASLGLAINTNVQAYSSVLDTYAAINPSANVQTMLGSANNAAILSNIGAQASDADLTTLATPTAWRMFYSNGSQAITGLALGADGTFLESNGASAAPAFRTLALSDLPTITPSKGGTGVANNDASTLTISGNYATTITVTGATGVTLPTTGTLAALGGANTWTGNNTFGNGDTDTLTIRSLIAGGNSRAVQITDSIASPTYATTAYEFYVKGDGEFGGNVYASKFISTGTDSFIDFSSQVSTPASSGTDSLYVIAHALKIKENGTEKDILTPSDSMTLTGTSISMAGVTNFVLPTATPDAAGEMAILTTAHQLAFHNGSGVVTMDFDGDSSGYVLKSDGAGNFTLQADATAGSPTLNSIGNPSADTTIAMDAGEEVNFQYTGNFTTGAQFLVRQLTGNPSGGTLFQVQAADGDATVARFGDGTNDFVIGAAGAVTLAGTATITSGGIVLGDSTPDANGEIGYASNAFVGYANSEDFSLTAGTNLWTFNSGSGALFAFTPAVTLTGGITSIGAAANLSGGTVTLGTIAGTVNLSTGTLSPSGSGVITANAVDAIGATGITIGSADVTTITLSGISENLVLTPSANTWTATTSTGVTSLNLNIVSVSANGFLPDAADGAALGSAAAEFSDIYLADGGVIYFQNDQSVYLTPSASTLTLTGSFALTVGLDVQGGSITLQNDETIGNSTDTEIVFTSNGNENLIFDLDTATDNWIEIKSGTGVTNLDISTLALTARIYQVGSFASPITNTGTYTIPTALCYGGVLYYNDTDTAALPAAVAGMSVTIYVTGTNLTTIDPNGTDVIVVDGTANAAGDAFTVAGAAGNFVCLVADATNHWVTLGAKGTLTAL